MIKIKIDDLVANALIELCSRGYRDFVTEREINNYGIAVMEDLSRKNIKAKLVLSKESTTAFEDRNKEFIVSYGSGYQINDNIKIDDLINRFRKNTNFELLDTFVNDDVISRSFNLYNAKVKAKNSPKKMFVS